jgi:excisionase family DNA binding protein
MEKLYRVSEAAEILRISRPSIYRLWRNGKVKPIKVGGRTVFPESELERFIEDLKARQP